MKTVEEIRKELGISKADFSKLINMSLRTYYGRFDGSQPDWLLKEVVEISKLNKGNVRFQLNDKTYDISIKEID